LHAANGKVQHPLRRPSVLIWVLGAGGRGERFFFSSCIWCGEWTVQCPLDIGRSMQVLFGGAGGGRGVFIFLSANRRAQSAFLLLLLS